MPRLLRKRLIPDECVELKDDTINYIDNEYIITSWKVLKPRKDLSHGFSLYDLSHGFKVSKFYSPEGEFLFWYCDIIKTDYNKSTDTYIFTDLLTDVIIYPDETFKVVDLDELATALSDGLISKEDICDSLRKTDALLKLIYAGGFSKYVSLLEAHISD
jgi:hypothetical protein